MRKFIGYLLLSSPFITIFTFVSIYDSVFVALGVFLGTAAIIGVIIAGVELVND